MPARVGGGTAAAEPGLRVLRMHAVWSGRQCEARPVGAALAALSGAGWSCRELSAEGQSVLGIPTVVLRRFSKDWRRVRAFHLSAATRVALRYLLAPDDRVRL